MKFMMGNQEHAFEVDCDVARTALPANPGVDGGAVVNARGEIVAIIQNALGFASLLTISVDGSEVRKFLHRAAKRYDLKYELPGGPGVESNTGH
jgi:hypothetical protein